MSQSSRNPPPSTFNGREADSLDLATAAEWTANDRRINPREKVRAYFFGRRIIEQILAQPGCKGLRVYYAIADDGQRHLLIVGADANQNDQLPRRRTPKPLGMATAAVMEAAQQPEQREPIIAEMAIPCPDQCGRNNELNTGRPD